MNNLDEYHPEFYELVTMYGKRYLSYHCFKCNKKHLIKTTAKEIARVRSAWRIVKKHNSDILILHCGKGEIPEIRNDGISMVIVPQSIISKSERDSIRKRIKRIIERLPFVAYKDSEITSTEALLKERIEKMENWKERMENAKKQMESDLEYLKRVG